MSGEVLTIGVLPLGRPTFDVPFAEEMVGGMIDDLKASGHRLIGPETLLMDAASTQAAMAEIAAENPDRILILQVTLHRCGDGLPDRRGLRSAAGALGGSGTAAGRPFAAQRLLRG